MSGKTPGFRWMKERAAENSEPWSEVGVSGVGGSKGDATRYRVVSMVERRFCATIICGPV